MLGGNRLGSRRSYRLMLAERRVDAPRGFEPRLTESESVVLPLDDGAPARNRRQAGEIERAPDPVNAAPWVASALAQRPKFVIKTAQVSREFAAVKDRTGVTMAQEAASTPALLHKDTQPGGPSNQAPPR